MNHIKNAFVRIEERLTRIGAGRLCWYGALALLLVLLGSASWAYRHRESVAAPDSPAPRAAMARRTPDPLTALVALPTSTPEPTPEPLLFVWPVEGEIIGEYADDSLVWCADLEQWQAHPALDIAAAAGEVVAACADGVVSDAWEDALWGNVIEITHPEGYVSTYANLSTLKLVNVGDSVTAGQTISAVGRTAACEASLPWHLHFSLKKSGDFVNFDKIVANNAG